MVILYLMISSSKAEFRSTYGDPLASTKEGSADADVVSKLGSIGDGPAGAKTPTAPYMTSMKNFKK